MEVDFAKNAFSLDEFRKALTVAKKVTIDVMYTQMIGARVALTKKQIESVLVDASRTSFPILAHWFLDKRGIGIHLYGNDSPPPPGWNNNPKKD